MLKLSVLLIIVIVLLTGCSFSQEEKKEKTEAGRLISFSYIYSNFRYRPFEYTIKRIIDDNGMEGILFKSEGYSEGLIYTEEEIEEAILDDIVRIMEEENIFAWNSFNKHNKVIRDGFSFELRAVFENLNVNASGYVEKPENFKEGHKRLSDYLLKLALSFRAE